VAAGLAAILIVFILPSTRAIGPTQVGLVTKRFSFRKLSKDSPIAFDGEPGYQADLLMPGLRFKSWVLYKVEKHSWVQVPAGEIGVVIAQVGTPLPIGAKSAVYKAAFANFSDLRRFIAEGGQKGVQRPVLPPGSLVPIHPVGFLVITKDRIYGTPVSPDMRKLADKEGRMMAESFGLELEQLDLEGLAGLGARDRDRAIDLVDPGEVEPREVVDRRRRGDLGGPTSRT